MLGLITKTIVMTITRPTNCGLCRTLVSEACVSFEEKLNLIRPSHVLQIKGLGTNDPALAFKIENLDEFVKWVEVTGARDLCTLEGPCDFALAAMFSALNVLVAAPSDASSAKLARACLAGAANLGSAVKTRRKKPKGQIKYLRDFGSIELSACIRHEADANWSWALPSSR